MVIDETPFSSRKQKIDLSGCMDSLKTYKICPEDFQTVTNDQNHSQSPRWWMSGQRRATNVCET